ncbi:MAG: UbiA-like polyprenyltransferase [Chloroflexota bacterium]
MRLLKGARDFLDLIKFEHTLFALPFAYLGMLLAARGWPTTWQFAWITVAMAAARTLGMSANRIIDRAFDARNPRTAQRPLITGAIPLRTAWAGSAASALILALAAYALGPLPFRLLPGALIFLIGYPYTKRFTVLTHLLLGATDGLAPLGAWAAVRGSLTAPSDLPAWILFATVTLWIGGFDLIYACQDVDFDRREGIYAVPARYGISAALRLSALAHAATTVLLVWLGFVAQLTWPYWTAVMLVTSLLAYEHALVRPDDLSRLDLAFFNVNGLISLTLFTGTLVALVL